VAKVHAGGQHVSHTYSHLHFSGLAFCHASQAPTGAASYDEATSSTREPVSKQAIFYQSQVVYTAPLYGQ
jgi:hypothetical protein